MVSGLKKMDLCVTHEIHYPVFLSQSSGPGIRCQIFQGFRLSRSTEGITQDVFDQSQRAKGNSTIGLNPIAQVFSELRVKHGLAVGA